MQWVCNLQQCGLWSGGLSAGASMRCDHAPSEERFGASGLATSQTIRCDELAYRSGESRLRARWISHESMSGGTP